MSVPRLILVSGWATNDLAAAPLRARLESTHPCEYVPWWECLSPNGWSGRGNALDAALRSADTPTVLIGWSLGVLACLRAAHDRPEGVSAMVLVSGTARMSGDGNYPGADPRALRAMRSKFRTAPAEVLEDFGALCMAPEEDAEWVAGFVRAAMDIDSAHGCLAAGLQYLQETDLRPLLPEIDAPTLVLHGDADHVVPVASARHMAGALPRAELVIVPDAGHAMLHLTPGRVEKEIRSFLGGRFQA